MTKFCVPCTWSLSNITYSTGLPETNFPVTEMVHLRNCTAASSSSSVGICSLCRHLWKRKRNPLEICLRCICSTISLASLCFYDPILLFLLFPTGIMSRVVSASDYSSLCPQSHGIVFNSRLQSTSSSRSSTRSNGGSGSSLQSSVRSISSKHVSSHPPFWLLKKNKTDCRTGSCEKSLQRPTEQYLCASCSHYSYAWPQQCSSHWLPQQLFLRFKILYTGG